MAYGRSGRLASCIIFDNNLRMMKEASQSVVFGEQDKVSNHGQVILHHPFRPSLLLQVN